MRTEQAYLCKTILPALVMAVTLPFFPGVVWSTVAISFCLTYTLTYLIGCNTYHRYWSHKQFKMRRWVEKTTAFLGLYALVGDPINYARTHRQHHAFADTWRDPHSPMHGRWHAFVGWMFKPGKKMGPTVIRDLLTPEYHYLQVLAGSQVYIVWMTWWVLACFPTGVLLGFVLAQVVAFILEMLVNAVGHDPVKGGAIDRKLIAWLALASYHERHHKNAGVAHPGDPGWIVIKLLERL